MCCALLDPSRLTDLPPFTRPQGPYYKVLDEGSALKLVTPRPEAPSKSDDAEGGVVSAEAVDAQVHPEGVAETEIDADSIQWGSPQLRELDIVGKEDLTPLTFQPQPMVLLMLFMIVGTIHVRPAVVPGPYDALFVAGVVAGCFSYSGGCAAHGVTAAELPSSISIKMRISHG